MVEVATGGGSGVSAGTGGSASNASNSEEQLPMVVRVPHLGYDPYNVCWPRYSLLGFGDILVPGMLVAFCHGFDLATQTLTSGVKRRFKTYYVTTLIGKTSSSIVNANTEEKVQRGEAKRLRGLCDDYIQHTHPQDALF